MYRNDMKKTWGVISDTLKRNRKSKSQAEFIYENHVIRDTDEIANHFNDYFINIACTLSQQIQPTHSFNNYLNNNSMLRFKFQPVDQNHSSQLIDKLKNKASYGHNNISTKLINFTDKVKEIKHAKKVHFFKLSIIMDPQINKTTCKNNEYIFIVNIKYKTDIQMVK